MVTGIFAEPLEGYNGPTGCCILSHEFYETDRARDFVRGYSFEILRGFGPVSTALWGMSAGRVLWGADHHRALRRAVRPHRRHRGDLRGPARGGNTVTLDPNLTDADGIPAPKITYRLSDNSRAMLEHSVARAKEVLQAAGATTRSSMRRCRSPAGT